MKYAIFNENGFPIAFYDSDIHDNIPNNAIQISNEQWLEFINNQGKRKWNFETKQVEVYKPPLPSLDELKQRIQKQLQSLEKQRLNQVLEGQGYLSIADIYFYASQNDTEAQAILNWYSNANGNGYDDLIWNWIDNILPIFQTVEDLLNLNLKQIEEDLFNQSITNNPL